MTQPTLGDKARQLGMPGRVGGRHTQHVNVIRKVAAAMRPLAANAVATCFFLLNHNTPTEAAGRRWPMTGRRNGRRRRCVVVG